MPRTGAHGKFTSERVRQIMAIGNESSVWSIVGHWTRREGADYAELRGILHSAKSSAGHPVHQRTADRALELFSVEFDIDINFA